MKLTLGGVRGSSPVAQPEFMHFGGETTAFLIEGAQGERILIDVPCSGVRMLWAGGFFASVLACALRLSGPQTLLLWSLSVVAVLTGNTARAIWIFLYKTALFAQPHWMHAGAGIVIFALVGCGIMSVALRMERRTLCAA